MFTGIITDIGRVLETEQKGDMRARIATGYDVESIDIGASIACDGTCLTVVGTGAGAETEPGAGTEAGAETGAEPWFEVSISAETLDKTNLSAWAPGKRINLERALRVGDELGGHIVSGHVDGLAEVIAMRQQGDSTRITLAAPGDLARFIAPKGSVALNGTSLTVNEVEGCTFGINLIPHTREVTTWGDVAVGEQINLEIDTLARYVARLQEWQP